MSFVALLRPGLLASLLCLLLSASQPAPGGAFVIRHGGTYSGTFTSDDSATPCLRVETTEPVVLRGCILRGPGNLVEATAGGARLTIVDCYGYGLPPTADQTYPGRFAQISQAVSVRIENNYMETVSGIAIYLWNGNGTPAQTLTVRRNVAKNMDGRYRNGGSTFANFLGLIGVRNVAGMEVAWNQVINEPNQSYVADNINFYNSGGTQASPVKLHDNYIQGAYPFPATSPSYAGSGITLDGDGSSALTTTAFVEGYNNILVSTCAALNIAAGHDNSFHNNRMVTSGYLPDGTKLTANFAGMGLWNEYKQPSTVFYNNHFRANTIGFVHWGGTTPFPDRQDLSPGACPACTGTNHLPNPITLATEHQEWLRWQHRLHQAGQQLGPSLPLGLKNGKRR